MEINLISKIRQIGYALEVSKHTLRWFLLLAVITISSRVVLILQIPSTMFFYDSYNYFIQASDFISFGQVSSTDPAFSILLGLWIAAFGFLSEPLIVARFLNIALALITSFFMFNLGKKFLGEDFAFISTILIMIEPIFLSFSITTHNDVFAMLNVVVSLSWALSQRRIFYVVGVPITFILAVLSKPFLYIVLGIPLILIYAHRIVKSNKSKRFKLAILLSILILYSSAPFFPSAQQYYYKQTRFDPIAKATIFLRPDIIRFVIDKTFLFTDIYFIDLSLQMLFIIGTLLIFNTFLTRLKRNKNASNQETIQFLPLFMLILVSLSILVFSITAIPYQIISGTVIPILDMNRRYVLWPRVAILWIVTFALWKIISTIIRHQAVRT